MDQIITIILTLLGMGQPPTPEVGMASQYDPLVMEAQLDYHELIPPCPGCAVASHDCSDIGEEWLIRPADGRLGWLPVVVADCAGDDGTPEWMGQNGIILELSFQLAVIYDTLGRGLQVEVIRP